MLQMLGEEAVVRRDKALRSSHARVFGLHGRSIIYCRSPPLEAFFTLHDERTLHHLACAMVEGAWHRAGLTRIS